MFKMTGERQVKGWRREADRWRGGGAVNIWKSRWRAERRQVKVWSVEDRWIKTGRCVDE